MKKRGLLIISLILTVFYLNQHRLIMVPTKEQHDTLNQQLKAAGITNQKLRIAIIALVNTEGGFQLKEEMSYSRTNVSRLRKVFGTRLQHLTDEQIDTLKKDDVAFYELIYGGRYGNSTYGDAYKYRGRGFNQLTFKSAYEKYSRLTGLDLVNQPELLNKPENALKVMAAYFIDNHQIGQRNGFLKRKFNVSHWDELKKQEDYNRLICQMNAGWGTNMTGSIFPEKLAKIDAIANKLTEYTV